MTTIKDLYKWAVKHNVENLPVGLQFQDEGDVYRGDTFTEYPDYEISAAIAEFLGSRYVLLE